MRKFNLSLDDFSPRPGTDNLFWCNKIIERYPNIKIDLFVPAAYCRLGEEPYYLSKNQEWVKKVSTFPKNYNINTHGMFHRRVDSKHPKSNNDEFQFLNIAEAEKKIDKMVEEFDKSGLKYNKIFRPPAWKISESATRVLLNRGFIIAGSREYYNKYKNKIPNLHKKWKSYNWDLIKPCKIKVDDIFAYGHTSDWNNNYMDKKRFELIDELLSKEEFVFEFIESWHDNTGKE